MPTKNTDQDIRTRIDSFLAELSGLVRKAALESVLEVLSGETAPRRRRGPGRPRGSGPRGPGRPRKAARRARRAVARKVKRVRRSAADLERIAARVMAHVKSNAGQRLEQIGKALKVETAILKRPIANLLATKKLSTKGQKRGTMYFTGGSRGGAIKSLHKAKSQRRRKAKNPRKEKVSRRNSRKKATRRAAPRIVRRNRALRPTTRRKPSKATRSSRARVIADALALQAAAIPGTAL